MSKQDERDFANEQAFDPIKQVSPDRAVLTHDDREMCPCCSEYPAAYVGGFCRRCTQSIEDERLERG